MLPSFPAFDAIDREFRPKILRYMAGAAAADDAADLTQTVLMKVAEHLHEFRGESSIATWIYRIAANVAVDHLRQRRIERAGIDNETDDDDEPHVPPELQAASTEATVARAQMSSCVREFVDRLPETYRHVIVLSEIEGFSNAEIARIAGVSLDTVKIRLHRARLKLRAELSSGCAIQRGAESGIVCEPVAPIRLR